jgi:hypothetical protein
MDGSHQVFMNSDATVFFLDVLPSLPAGLLVGIHDVFLPDDYPPEWANSFIAEQYLLAAYLLAESPWLQPELVTSYVNEHRELHEIVLPRWLRVSALRGLQDTGHTFWLTIGAH